MLIAGDLSPMNKVAERIESGDLSSVFGEIQPLIRDVDYSIVNFESVIADSNDEAINKCGPALRSTPKSLEAIRRIGFDMVTLANNHFYDYGEIGVMKSLKLIKDNGLDYVGGGTNITDASKTLYKEIADKTFAFINCCEHEFSIATDTMGGCNPLNPIQQYYKIQEAKQMADYVIVIVHGGHEHFQLPSLRMQELYRFFVDVGADVVVNHHQHCYSGYEIYKSKPIFYGLGNFCFDYANIQNATWYYGYMLSLSFDNSLTFNLIPYEQCLTEPTIKLLKNTTDFDASVVALNKIITDRECLSNALETYYSDSSIQYLSVFEPYHNRILRKLYRMNLLPSFINGKNRYNIRNYIECESHRDKTIYALSNTK